MTGSLTNLSAIALTIFIATCIAIDVRRKPARIMLGRNVVLITILLWYLLEALSLPAYLSANFTQSQYDFGVFAVFVSTCTFLAAYAQSRLQFFAPFERRLIHLDNPRVAWALLLLCFFLGFGGLLVYTRFQASALFEGLWGLQTRWSGALARGRYGGFWTIFYELQLFLAAAVPVAFALILSRGASQTQKAICTGFIVWMSLRAFAGGTRSQLIPILLPAAAALYWYASPLWRKRLIVVGLPFLAIGGYLASAAIVAGRNEGALDWSEAEEVDYVGNEMFRELVYISYNVPLKASYQLGYTYFTQLVNPIPRSLWPGKPVADAGLIMARVYGAIDVNGEPTLTVSPGFLGEAYLNFGLLGLVLIPAIAGVIVRSWDSLAGVASRSFIVFLVYAAGLAAIFNSGRSFNISTFYGLLGLFVVLLLLEQFGFYSTHSRRVELGTAEVATA